VRAPEEMARRESRHAHALTFGQVVQLREQHDLSRPEELMRYAAICLAVACLMRPSEMLGAAKRQSRALTLEQFTWFEDEQGERRMGGQPTLSSRPAVGEVRIRVSKTDQEGRGISKIFAAPTALDALWRWWCFLHRNPTSPSQLMFCMAGERPLTTGALTRHTQLKAAELNIVAEIKGRSWRRGGASSLAGTGIDEEALRDAGHWAEESSAHKRYTDAAAKRKRVIATSKALEGPAAGPP
jgi:hypothetical protein